ncbi:MAG: hypothetical protein F6J87_11110 [Spirulina sp. SIO3F2]|nr:hypothetical protein [Spirulina sp. SIO3F2]
MIATSSKAIFLEHLERLHRSYLPSKHPFFRKLSSMPKSFVSSPIFLGELYNRYQSFCHATRVMIYFLPSLNQPELRVRKFKIISHDDSVNTEGGIHHYQLKNLFLNLHATSMLPDHQFGDIEDLQNLLDAQTAQIILVIKDLYPKSLGAWCVVEMFADDWMRALMHSLSIAFPSIEDEPYFSECFLNEIEVIHAREAIDLTCSVLNSSRENVETTLECASLMAKTINDFWTILEVDLLAN